MSTIATISKPMKAKTPGHRRKFGTVYQRPDGIWEGKYTFKGQRVSIYGDTEDDVENQLILVQANVQNQTYKESSGMFLKDWITIWLRDYARTTVRHSTYINYESNMLNHVIPELGQVSLRSLDGARLQKFFKKKSESGRADGQTGGLSNKTLLNIRNTMNECFLQAIFNGHMHANPISGVRLPKKSPKEMRVLTREEMYKLIAMCNVADTRFAYGVIFTLYTGMRLGEVLGLKWSDITALDGESPVAHIRKTLNRLKKPRRNNPDYEIIRWNPGNTTAIVLGTLKTDKSRRDIYLPSIAADSLRKIRHWHNQMIDTLGRDFNPHNFIFTSLKGDAMEPRTYLDYFYDLVKSSGIERANYHALRHTFATRGNEFGIDTATLSELLGHAKKSTTLDMYVHSLDESKLKARNTFDQM